MAGAIKIAFDLRKDNVINPFGGGITGRIFVDGTEVFSQFIANTDGSGVQGSFIENVSVGSKIDFAIDPLGITPPTSGDDNYSARADASIFSATISLTAWGRPHVHASDVHQRVGVTVSAPGAQKKRHPN